MSKLPKIEIGHQKFLIDGVPFGTVYKYEIAGDYGTGDIGGITIHMIADVQIDAAFKPLPSTKMQPTSGDTLIQSKAKPAV